MQIRKDDTIVLPWEFEMTSIKRSYQRIVWSR
jgi:hypothetical protein